MTPGELDLWFLPLGGTGEIGLNMNLYGHNGRWIMVDCGVSFDEPLVPLYRSAEASGEPHRIVCADPTFIVENKSSLSAIVITHAHEDHIGALADLWPALRVPIYATPFTSEIARRKFAQAGLYEEVDLIVVPPGSTRNIEPFVISWLTMNHSIPEPSALIIRTQVGTVLHTADWKFDPAPLVGQSFCPDPFVQLADEGPLTVVGDSTNATKAGWSLSEKTCYQGLLDTIRSQPNRVVVGCFASNIARLIALARIAKQTKRYLCLLGRSLDNMVGAARATGYWPDNAEIINSSHAGYLLKHEVLAVATGTQGEPKAALARLAFDHHPNLVLDAGDTVIFSSIAIPGNEKAIQRILDQFSKRRINVVTSEQHNLPIHASGHPNRDELSQLYQWVKPNLVIATHGEPRHLQAHADVARQSGVKKTLVGLNGDLFRIAPQPSLRRDIIKVGRRVLQRS